MKRHKLTATDICYYSAGDECAFFEWLRSIPCVADTEGAGRQLIISLSRSPNDDELRELIALFYRYGIEMGQLVAFATSNNEGWLREPKAFWFSLMFDRRPIRD